jgi:GT2 family glycosyltransferase
MDRTILIGVVTVTYNSSSVMHEFMESALKQSYKDFSLYIVDNRSSDETLELVSKYQDSRIVAIPNRTNVGVAEGNNIGIRAALNDGCDCVLLINNDTVFGPNLFSALLEGLLQYNCDIIVPKIMQFDDPETIWYGGGHLSKIRASAIHYGDGEKDIGQFNAARLVSYSPTCCMLIKKEVFARVGMMDELYFVYCDDTDFCNRAFRSGIKLFYVPSAKLLHKVSSLTQKQSTFSLMYGTRNRIYYLWKNFSFIQFLVYLPIFQLQYLLKFIVRDYSPERYWIAQKAFWEGLGLSVSKKKRNKVRNEILTRPSDTEKRVVTHKPDEECESVPR